MENTDDVEIVPTVRNGIVVELSVDGVKQPLKSGITVQSLQDLIGNVTMAAHYIDFRRTAEPAARMGANSSLNPWAPDELQSFIENELKDDQIETLLVMSDGEERRHDKFLAAVGKKLGKEVGSMKAGGMLSGISVKSKVKLHEPPHTIEERIVNGKWHRFYRLTKPEYANPIVKAAKGRDLA